MTICIGHRIVGWPETISSSILILRRLFIASQAVTSEGGTPSPTPFQPSWPENKSHEVSKAFIPLTLELTDPLYFSFGLFEKFFCFFYVHCFFFLPSSGEHANLGFDLGEGSLRPKSSSSSNSRPSSWSNPLQRFPRALTSSPLVLYSTITVRHFMLTLSSIMDIHSIWHLTSDLLAKKLCRKKSFKILWIFMLTE